MHSIKHTLVILALSVVAVSAWAATPVKTSTATSTSVSLPQTPAPAGASVYFISPKNGATIKGPVVIKFGLIGMGVAPAGVKAENTGHHHLLIDLETLPDMTKPLPANGNIKHFGGGQTEVEIIMSPGKHTLQLLLGDHLHRPHNPPVLSEKITVTITK
jgi:Domain of unknown function (DUF4399)